MAHTTRWTYASWKIRGYPLVMNIGLRGDLGLMVGTHWKQHFCRLYQSWWRTTRLSLWYFLLDGILRLLLVGWKSNNVFWVQDAHLS